MIEQLRDITALYAAMPQVVAVALGGSHGAGQADESSDVDLYVYTDGDIPLGVRRQVAEQRGQQTEVDVGYWGPEDGWLEREGGTHVEVIYRQVADMQGHLAARLERHEPDVGYSTAFLFTFQHSRILHDPLGWLRAVQERVNQPYPAALARAIVQHNFPLLRGLLSSYPHQIRLAVQRGDVVSVNHRLAAFLASYFDILFALNRVYHPGEKRLLTYAGNLPLKPAHLTGRVDELLTFTRATLQALPGKVEGLIDDLEILLKEYEYDH